MQKATFNPYAIVCLNPCVKVITVEKQLNGELHLCDLAQILRFSFLPFMAKRKEDGLWVKHFLWNLKYVSNPFCLSTKLGQVDRGRRPRGSLPEPGVDEEQPMGGERKVHPPLEETIGPVMTLHL